MDVRHLGSLLLFSLSFSSVFATAETLPPPPNLEARIHAYQNQSKGPGPSATDLAVMQQAAEDVAAALPEPGLKVGSLAPDFELPNAYGEPIRLSTELKKGPVVLTFYRGAWCPFCNLQLKALRESLPHFQRQGATLIAITPQTPDHSLSQVKKDGYPFAILSDLSDQVSKAYGLYFEVPDALHELYVNKFDLDITHYNGAGRQGLPVPGTFIIDRHGVIRSAFAETDYKQRMEPQAIVDALAALQAP